MKAILIIDIPNNINVKECVVNYQVYHNFQNTDYKEILNKKNINLKPLPGMITGDIETDMSRGNDYASGYRDGWNKGSENGWNTYREVITGE